MNIKKAGKSSNLGVCSKWNKWQDQSSNHETLYYRQTKLQQTRDQSTIVCSKLFEFSIQNEHKNMAYNDLLISYTKQCC